MNRSPIEVVDAPRRRVGFWSKLGGGPLTFAILVHLIVLLLAGIWAFTVTVMVPAHDRPRTFIPQGGGDTPNPLARPGPPTKRTNIPVAADVKRVVAREAIGLTIPPGESIAQPSVLPSLGNDTFPGGSPGEGPGTGPGIAGGDPTIKRLLPPIRFDTSMRCSQADRMARVTSNGGTEACETAVVKALRWLKANQNPDGSWGTNHKAAMTGLALLAYLGHCEHPRSLEFGDSCYNAIVYLVNLGMQNDGRMGSNPTAQPFCYEHAIATYALAEAYVFCKQTQTDVPNLQEITQQAGQFIIDHQHENGGWSYGYARTAGHVDLSVTGWQLQALSACSHSTLTFERLVPCRKQALDYVKSCQNKNGGYGYTRSNDGERNGYMTLTGVGMLSNQMWQEHSSDVRKAAGYVHQNTRFDYNSEFCDLYGHYYESQAMMRLGGKDWRRYNDLFRDQLLLNQDADGSWKTPGGGKPARAAGAEYVNNKLYRTCLCTLMLEVYYRFLNSDGGGTRPRL